jgi:hypothetical protein
MALGRRRFEQIGPPAVSWGETLCAFQSCAELADCLLERWPYCLRHADELLERWLAVELAPGIAQVLPPLEEGPW